MVHPPLRSVSSWINFQPASCSLLHAAILKIGFDFQFNGDVFDVIGISNGGWISFGKSSDGLDAVWVYNYTGHSNADPLLQAGEPTDRPYRRNRVAGFGLSSIGQVDWTSLNPPGNISTLRMATIGTAPNRVCVVQWENYGARADNTSGMNKFNFQIRLNEVDNSVEVVFGPMAWVNAGPGRYERAQAGLGGQTNADFNGRMTVYEQPAFVHDWNNTVAADNNSAICQFDLPQPDGPAIPPAVGLTWRWESPVCAPPAWPLTITNVSFSTAEAAWQAALGGSGQYEIFLSTEDDPNGPEVFSEVTGEEIAFLNDLEQATDYYLFIRSICNGTPGPWSLGTHFRTLSGQMVACDGSAIDVDYCSNPNEVVQWHYVSGDGSPLRIDFFDGYTSQIVGEYFKIWNVNPYDQFGNPIPGVNLIYSAPVYNNMAGQTFNTPTGEFFLELKTMAGACSIGEQWTPFQWRIGCKDCTDPLVNFDLGEVDCDNGEFFINVDIFSMGSATSLLLVNDAGTASTEVTTTGVHTVGPFPAGMAVAITVQDPDHQMCYVEGTPIAPLPCPLVTCGPETFTYCYDNNEIRQWAYQGEATDQIGLRFTAGTLGWGDFLRFYQSLDPDDDPAPVAATTGDLANQLFTSGDIPGEHTLVMQLTANGSHSCATEDPVEGTTSPWEYVVACYDGCIQPQAAFADSCISTQAFLVNVTITELGSTGSVTITGGSGSTPVTATATGTYSMGPFQANVPVTINVEGASVLCTYTSAGRVKDCSDWTAPDGIGEHQAGRLNISPNPGDGNFRMDLPANMAGAQVLVYDPTGRVVHSTAVSMANSALQLEHLPAGLYTVVAQAHTLRLIGKVSIQH